MGFWQKLKRLLGGDSPAPNASELSEPELSPAELKQLDRDIKDLGELEKFYGESAKKFGDLETYWQKSATKTDKLLADIRVFKKELEDWEAGWAIKQQQADEASRQAKEKLRQRKDIQKRYDLLEKRAHAFDRQWERLNPESKDYERKKASLLKERASIEKELTELDQKSEALSKPDNI